MEVIKTNIEGVLIIEPKVFGDKRGYFFESFSQREFDEKVAPILVHTIQYMRLVGLEPTRLAAQEPKSCMSANSITTATYKTISCFHSFFKLFYQNSYDKRIKTNAFSKHL